MEAPGAVRDVAAPVLLLAFDRPHYLERVCAALAAQRGVRLDPSRVWLVQDGAVSALTGRRFTDDAALEAATAAFRRHFPLGQVRRSRHNLGVARNMRRAERLAFEELDADLAYIIEEDFEPGPWYLMALERMRELTAPHSRVGYFAAQGDHRRDYPGPAVNYIPMEHNWAFGLWRRCWRQMEEWLPPYYALLEGRDYPDRPHRAVFELFRPLSIASEASSQDAAKSIACLELGFSRVQTTVCFGRPIGEVGHSFSPESFRARGLDRVRIAEATHYDFPPLTEEKLDEVDGFHRRHYERLRRGRFEDILASYG